MRWFVETKSGPDAGMLGRHAESVGDEQNEHPRPRLRLLGCKFAGAVAAHGTITGTGAVTAALIAIAVVVADGACRDVRHRVGRRWQAERVARMLRVTRHRRRRSALIVKQPGLRRIRTAGLAGGRLRRARRALRTDELAGAAHETGGWSAVRTKRHRESAGTHQHAGNRDQHQARECKVAGSSRRPAEPPTAKPSDAAHRGPRPTARMASAARETGMGGRRGHACCGPDQGETGV